MTPRRELIRLQGVEKWYGRQSVLRIGELAIHEGERVMLSGANGSGKSTLLKLLARIAPVDRGRIWWADELRRGSLGYVPQHGGMYQQLSVHDNLQLRRDLHGRKPADPQDLEYVRALGLAPVLSKPFAQLSGGYQRLAAIASALHVDPMWLLLDEPFGGVDPENADFLRRLLADIDDTILLMVVASPPSESFPTANRFLHIENGQLEWSAR